MVSSRSVNEPEVFFFKIGCYLLDKLYNDGTALGAAATADTSDECQNMCAAMDDCSHWTWISKYSL